MTSADPHLPDGLTGANPLRDTFKDQAFRHHGSKWDYLWKHNFTPWDRSGPSLALSDLLVQHPQLFAQHHLPASGTKRRPRALVPGCGRGYDALLLSSFGYDVCGLDSSPTALREAHELERAVASAHADHSDDDAYAIKTQVQGVTERGSVTWLNGDFFDDVWVEALRQGGDVTEPVLFDLIFDYTVGSIPSSLSLSLSPPPKLIRT